MELLALILITSFITYGVTKIITESYIAKGFRNVFRDVMWEICPWARHMVRWFHTESDEDQVILVDDDEVTYDGVEVKGYDFIACPLCVGFWVSLVVCAFAGCGWWFLAAYGAATFIHTQER